MPSKLDGQTALITGASSGLGVDFARELAARGCDLILVARREERLRAVQQELTGRHNVDVTIISQDLAQLAAPQELYDEVHRVGRQVDILVNNAGYGPYGEFLSIPWDREENMLAVNINAVVHLTKLFLPGMVARNNGRILLVGSIGSFVPSPLYASYSASKSYVLSLGLALNYELRHTKVSCTVVTPGMVRTEFHQVAGQSMTLYQRLVIMDSATVGRITIRALLQRRAVIIPGWLNAATVFAFRFIPARLAVAMAHLTMA